MACVSNSSCRVALTSVMLRGPALVAAAICRAACSGEPTAVAPLMSASSVTGPTTRAPQASCSRA